MEEPGLPAWRDQTLVNKEFFAEKPVVEEEEDEFRPLLKGRLPTTPTAPPPVQEVPPAGTVNANTALQNKVIGLFFSAVWCPPCRQFVPQLKELYEELKKRNSPFEVVFISFDKKKEEMASYFTQHHGDWLAVPFGDKLIEEMKTKYNVSAIPRLFIVRDDGQIITARGRKEVQDKGVIGFRNWQMSANITAKELEEHAQKMSGDGDQDKTLGKKKTVTIAESETILSSVGKRG